MALTTVQQHNLCLACEQAAVQTTPRKVVMDTVVGLPPRSETLVADAQPPGCHREVGSPVHCSDRFCQGQQNRQGNTSQTLFSVGFHHSLPQQALRPLLALKTGARWTGPQASSCGAQEASPLPWCQTLACERVRIAQIQPLRAGRVHRREEPVLLRRLRRNNDNLFNNYFRANSCCIQAQTLCGTTAAIRAFVNGVENRERCL